MTTLCVPYPRNSYSEKTTVKVGCLYTVLFNISIYETVHNFAVELANGLKFGI